MSVRINNKVKAVMRLMCAGSHKWGIRLIMSQRPAPEGKVLFWTSSGMLTLTELHASLGLALTMYGYPPHFVLCDESCKGACIPASEPENAAIQVNDWEARCKGCVQSHVKLMHRYGFEYSFVSQHIGENDLVKIERFSESVVRLANLNKHHEILQMCFGGVNIGRDIVDTLIRHCRTCDYSLASPEIVSAYSRMAAITTVAYENSLLRYAPTHNVIPHPIYAAAGPAQRVAKKHGKGYFHYQGHHRNGFVYKTITADDTCNSAYGLSSVAWEDIKTQALSEKEEKEISSFFLERYLNNAHVDTKGLNLPPVGTCAEMIRKSLGILDNKKIYGIYTHMTWDNTFGFGSPPFDHFDHWLHYTVETIMSIKDVNWVIKINPTERHSDGTYSDKGAFAYLQRFFPKLPRHISVLLPDTHVSPYDFLQLCTGVVSCNGTSGLEGAVLGKVVVNACCGYYSRLGFTLDSSSREEYAGHLQNAARHDVLTYEQVQMAKKFFHVFFFRRGIPLYGINPSSLAVETMAQAMSIARKKNTYINLLCEKLLSADDVIIPREWENVPLIQWIP